MATTPYVELQALLSTYKKVLYSSLKVEKLRACLQSVSEEDVYQLLAWKGETAIYTAIQRDQVEILSCLLDSITEKQRYELLLTMNRNGASWLHFAAYFGSNEAARSICQFVSVEHYRFQLLAQQTSNGLTALHQAALDDNTELLTIILESVEPDQQIQLLDITDDYNRTVLDVAQLYNNQSTAELIEQHYQRDITLSGGSEAYYQAEITPAESKL